MDTRLTTSCPLIESLSANPIQVVLNATGILALSNLIKTHLESSSSAMKLTNI